MSTQKYTNLAQSLLASGYTPGNTTITVTTGDGALFPTAGDFMVAMDSPPAFFLKCTSRAGDVLTVTSTGQEGSTAASKSSGTAVTQVITAGCLDNIRADMIQSGTTASLPSSDRAGNLYLPTDGVHIYRDTGAAFTAHGPIFKFVKPVFANYAWINQGSTTVDSASGGIYVQHPAGASLDVSILKKAAPATPYKITACFQPALVNANYGSVGLGFRESSSGKIQWFATGYENGFNIYVFKLTNPTTFSAHYSGSPFSVLGALQALIWLRIEDNGTNRICSISVDGQHWIVVHTIGRTDFLTANEVAFGAHNQNASWPTGINLLSWEES